MTKSKAKQPEHQPKSHNTEQPESPAKPEVPTKASSWRLPKGFTVVEDGESYIFIGGFPCAPPKDKK